MVRDQKKEPLYSDYPWISNDNRRSETALATVFDTDGTWNSPVYGPSDTPNTASEMMI